MKGSRRGRAAFKSVWLQAQTTGYGLFVYSKLSDSAVDGGIICSRGKDELQQIVGNTGGFSQLPAHG